MSSNKYDQLLKYIADIMCLLNVDAVALTTNVKKYYLGFLTVMFDENKTHDFPYMF